MFRQHVESVADAPCLHGANEDASHASDAKFGVDTLRILK